MLKVVIKVLICWPLIGGIFKQFHALENVLFLWNISCLFVQLNRFVPGGRGAQLNRFVPCCGITNVSPVVQISC